VNGAHHHSGASAPAGPEDGATRSAPAGPAAGSRREGPVFWLSAAAGWAVIAYGLRGLYHHRIDTRPGNYARFAIGGALVHDLVLAPIVLLIGVGVSRSVRGRARAPVQAGLIVSGIVLLFAYPLVRGFGHATRNPSSEPHNYTANVIVVVGAVWVLAAAVGVLTAAVSRRRVHGPT